MELSQPDRRFAPRYAVDAEATLILVNHAQTLRARMLELSLEGCRMRAERLCALPMPANIEVIFKIHGMGFRLGGTMQWADARQTAGIRFSPLAPRRLEILTELLSELEAQNVPRAQDAPTGDPPRYSHPIRLPP